MVGESGKRDLKSASWSCHDSVNVDVFLIEEDDVTSIVLSR